jgi:cytochrome P450
LRTYGRLFDTYGEIVRVPLPAGHTMFLLSRPEHAEHVLVSARSNYIKAFSYRPLRAFLGSGLLTSEGEVWSARRSALQPEFTRRRIGDYVPAITAATSEVLDAWHEGRTIAIDAELRALTLDTVGRCLLGVKLGAAAERVGYALSRVQRGVMAGIGAALLPGLPERILEGALRRAPGLRGPAQTLDTLARDVVRRARSGDVRSCVVDRLAGPGTDGTAGALDDTALRDEVLTIMLAGHETTAAALAWSLILLSRHPDARHTLEDEVDQVLAGRDPVADDLDRLPWTRAVISEAMRLYPPAWTVERDAVRDDEIDGVVVPAGATVVVSPHLLHRNSQLWRNPEGFDPSRFVDSVDRSRYAYLPFGGGRRICIGAGFAMLEATVILAMIARRYRLDLLPHTSVRPRAEITLRPAGPVPMVIRARHTE